MHLYYIFKYSICKHAYFTHLLLYVAYLLFGVIGPAEEEGQGGAPAPSGRGEGRKEAQGVGEAPAEGPGEGDREEENAGLWKRRKLWWDIFIILLTMTVIMIMRENRICIHMNM